MTIIIGHEVVPELISMGDAIGGVADAYASLARGEAVESPRGNLVVPSGWIRTMAAALPGSGFAGYKEFHRFSGVSQYAYHLFDLESGEQVALMDGRHLTALRTGACGGLAAREMSAPGSRSLGMIGTGHEAKAQLEAVLAVRDIATVKVFSRTAANREAFCEYATMLKPSIDAKPVGTGEEAFQDVDIAVAATNTAGRGPAVLGDFIADRPFHVNSVGSTMPNQRELHEAAWAKMRRVVIDSPDVLEESGDAIAARHAGVLDHSVVGSLGSLVEESGSEVLAAGPTLYKSVGSAIQDIAMAVIIYRRALESGQDLPVLRPFQAVRTIDVPDQERRPT